MRATKDTIQKFKIITVRKNGMINNKYNSKFKILTVRKKWREQQEIQSKIILVWFCCFLYIYKKKYNPKFKIIIIIRGAICEKKGRETRVVRMGKKEKKN